MFVCDGDIVLAAVIIRVGGGFDIMLRGPEGLSAPVVYTYEIKRQWNLPPPFSG